MVNLFSDIFIPNFEFRRHDILESKKWPVQIRDKFTENLVETKEVSAAYFKLELFAKMLILTSKNQSAQFSPCHFWDTKKSSRRLQQYHVGQ